MLGWGNQKKYNNSSTKKKKNSSLVTLKPEAVRYKYMEILSDSESIRTKF